MVASWYAIKHRGIFGPELGDLRKIDILNRTIEWVDGGIEYRADPRHARMLVEELGLEGESKGKDAPGEKEDEREEEGDLLDRGASARWRHAPTTWPWTGSTFSTRRKKHAVKCLSRAR